MEIMPSNFLSLNTDGNPPYTQGEVTVGGGDSVAPRPSKNDGVQISGQIIDNDTQRGIKDAFFIVLNPGVTFEKFEAENLLGFIDLHLCAGRFAAGISACPIYLQRGVSYNILVAAEGYTSTGL